MGTLPWRKFLSSFSPFLNKCLLINKKKGRDCFGFGHVLAYHNKPLTGLAKAQPCQDGINWMRRYAPGIPALERWEKEDHEVWIIPRYTTSWIGRPALATSDPLPSPFTENRPIYLLRAGPCLWLSNLAFTENTQIENQEGDD